MQILLLISTLFLALLAYPCITLYQNYLKARTTGLPVLLTPIGPFNPIWQLFNAPLTPILQALPFGLGRFVDRTGFHWFFPNRYRHHVNLGPAFAIASPGEVQVIIADPDTVDEILTRRKDFDKDLKRGRALDIFGRNLVTAGNDTWARQRRLTTPPFNERNSSFVWKESLRQSTDMLKTWVSQKPEEGVEATPNDAMTLTLHVLIAAGLGKTYDFDGGTTNLTGEHTISYRDALKIILFNIIGALLVNSLPLPTSYLPAKLRELRNAVKEFREYMNEMMTEERKSLHLVEAEKDNLMTVLLKASESKGDSVGEGGSGRMGLSDDEILGNLFIYNLAGHDTTANTITYALHLLSVYPEVQEWIREEILSVFPLERGNEVEGWEYEKAFPRLKRCMALMNETLRLYGPVVANMRSTGNSHQPIHVGGKTHIIPPNTHVFMNMTALATFPQLWGEDSLVWRPNRWISSPSSSSSSSSNIKEILQTEEFLQPKGTQGAFIPFSTGPRVCPGKKFAQVEFVAVIARLF